MRANCQVFLRSQVPASQELRRAVLEGKYSKGSGFYTTLMAEYCVNAFYPDLIVHHIPANAAKFYGIEEEPQPHRENEPCDL